LTYALAAEWRERKGKTAAGNQAFRVDLHQAQVLTCHARALKRLAAALRRTKGKMAASQLAASSTCGRICAAAGWHVSVRGVDGCHEIAEYIP
jgi:hypothetical protein